MTAREAILELQRQGSIKGLTLAQIAQQVGVSTQRVQQLYDGLGIAPARQYRTAAQWDALARGAGYTDFAGALAHAVANGEGWGDLAHRLGVKHHTVEAKAHKRGLYMEPLGDDGKRQHTEAHYRKVRAGSQSRVERLHKLNLPVNKNQYLLYGGRRQIGVRVTTKQWERLQATAEAQGISVSHVAYNILATYLDGDKEGAWQF